MGKTASQESGLAPKHDVLGSGTSYEIRAYAPYLVAEVEAGKDVRTEDRFKVLAKVSNFARDAGYDRAHRARAVGVACKIRIEVSVDSDCLSTVIIGQRHCITGIPRFYEMRNSFRVPCFTTALSE